MRAYRERLKIIKQCIDSFAIDVQRDLFIPQMNVHETSQEFIPSRMVQIFEQYMRNDQINQINIAKAQIQQLRTDIEETKALIEHTKRDTAQTINNYALHSAEIKNAYRTISRRVSKIENSLNGKIEQDEAKVLAMKKQREQLKQHAISAKHYTADIKEQLNLLKQAVQQNNQSQIDTCEKTKNYIKKEIQHRLFLTETRVKNDLDNQIQKLKSQKTGTENRIKQLQNAFNDIARLVSGEKAIDILQTDKPIDQFITDAIEQNISRRVEKETKLGEDRKLAAKKFKQMYDDAIRKKEAEVDARLREAKERERALIEKIKEATQRFTPYSKFMTPSKTAVSLNDLSMDSTMSRIRDIQDDIRRRPPMTPI